MRGLRPDTKTSVEDTTNLLERLARLREQNVIDEDEFERLKAKVLSPVL